MKSKSEKKTKDQEICGKQDQNIIALELKTLMFLFDHRKGCEYFFSISDQQNFSRMLNFCNVVPVPNL